MPAAQPGSILNLVLLLACGCGGWFAAAWFKPPRKVVSVVASVESGGPAYRAGVFAGDARRILEAKSAGAAEFDEFSLRYGTGSPELTLLTLPLLEKWSAAAPADAATNGITRCLRHAPENLPPFLARLAESPSTDPATLLTTIPQGPLYDTCLRALASGLGLAARPLAADILTKLPRHGRSAFLREWHRSRAAADYPAASSSANALSDADDRESAIAGTLVARAGTDPALTLGSSGTRADFAALASQALTDWIARDSSAAWQFAVTLQNDPRLPAITAAMIRAEAGRRRLSDAIPDMTALLDSLFPRGLPVEPLTAFIQSLSREKSAAAQKYADSLPGETRLAAGVVLFDAFCETDPDAAWRLAGALVRKSGANDHRTMHTWTNATARQFATPAQRLAAGFPDLSDMIQLANRWLQTDPPAAIATFCAPGVPVELQKLVILTALSPHGGAIPSAQLKEWGKSRPDHIRHLIENLTAEAAKPN